MDGIISQVLVAGYLRKEIEQYGVIKLTQIGVEYIENPTSFMMTEDHVIMKKMILLLLQMQKVLEVVLMKS